MTSSSLPLSRALAKLAAAGSPFAFGGLGASPHPAFETLIGYSAGELDPDEEATVRDHLPFCDTCPRLLLALTDWRRRDRVSAFAARDGVNGSPWAPATNAEEVSEPAGATALAEPAHWPRWSRGALAAVMIVAGLFVAVSLTAVALREQGKTLGSPVLDVALFTVELPRGAREAPLVTLGRQRTVLQLDLLQSASSGETYDLEILTAGAGRANRQLWSGHSGPLSADHLLTLEIPDGFLAPGEYRLVVRGGQAGGLEAAGELRILAT